MSNLRQLQRSFQDALRGRSDAIITAIVKPPAMTAHDRMQVYCNDYFFRLRDALKDDYPALCYYLGDCNFEELAQDYISDFPSKTFTIREVGYRFPKFLKNRAQSSEIIELAQFETEIIKVLFSSEAEVLDLNALTKIAPEQWGDLKFHCHPSLRCLSCQYNSVDFWLAVDGGESPTLQVLDVPVTQMIWYNQGQAFFRALSLEEIILLSGIQEGYPFSDLCEKMLDYFTEDEVVTWIAGVLQVWINDGIFSC